MWVNNERTIKMTEINRISEKIRAQRWNWIGHILCRGKIQ